MLFTVSVPCSFLRVTGLYPNVLYIIVTHRGTVKAGTLKKEQCTDTRNSIGYMRNCSLFLAVLDIYRYTTNAISCMCVHCSF